MAKKCPKCSAIQVKIFDCDNTYDEFCCCCGFTVSSINKQELLDNFTCPKCNCFSGKIEENAKFFAIRCSNCNEQNIIFEKHTDIDNRNKIPVQPTQSNLPKCPTCSSTRIQKISGGRKLMGVIGFGLLSKTAKSQFECLDCKYMW